jgi:hypothetical protein
MRIRVRFQLSLQPIKSNSREFLGAPLHTMASRFSAARIVNNDNDNLLNGTHRIS